MGKQDFIVGFVAFLTLLYVGIGPFYTGILVCTLLILLLALLAFLNALADRAMCHIQLTAPPTHWKVDYSECSLFHYLPQLRSVCLFVCV